jgi:hypothetical protein
MKRSAVFLAAITLLAGASSMTTSAQAACEPGTKLDSTTVDSTRILVTKAGYKNPQHLRKGCDSAWHGTATKNGAAVSIAVTTDGKVVEEGE